MLYLIPAMVGAAIGYFTNLLAIKMMFWPREPLFIFGFRVPLTQGLIALRKKDIATAIAHVAEHQFVDAAHLAKVALQANDDGRIWKSLRGTSLGTVWLMYKGSFDRDDFESHLEELCIRAKSEGLVKEIVESRIGLMDVGQIEDTVMQVASKECQHIALLGAILGAIVGATQPLVGRLVEMILV